MNRAGPWQAAALLALAGGLAGCATPPSAPATAGPFAESSSAIAGRLLLKVDGSPGQPPRTLSAGFELQGDERTGRLRLLSPLGTVLADARWAPGGAWLRDGASEQAFDDLPSLAAQALGEPLPLGAVSHWLQARPWPGAAHALTAEGFTQLGWQIDLRQWAEAGQIEARRSTAPGVLLRARLDR